MLWLVGFAGCYSPGALPEGAPCQRSAQCPESQDCVQGSCSRSAPSPADAAPAPPPDARADAMVDAMPVPCVPTGLTCSTTPTVYMCGNHCWVKCTDAVLRTTAETRCTGWTGALAEIDDATDNDCIAMKISTAAFWFGAIQGDGAATPADKWTWNGNAGAPLKYVNWSTGKPDDAGDGVENGDEQCGTIRPGGTWDDDTCNQQLGFFCTHPLFQ